MTLNTKSTLDDFIKFFEGIPDEKWCENVTHKGDQCCAYGHLVQTAIKFKMYAEDLSDTLHRLAPNFVRANDNLLPKYQHLPTPRLRVVEYLKDVRDGRSIE